MKIIPLFDREPPSEEYLTPALFLIKDFLIPDECDHIIELARPKLKRSDTIDNNTGESTINDYRTSKTCFLPIGLDETIQSIEQKIAEIVNLPISHGEQLQVAQYNEGEYYKPHHDYFDKNWPGSGKHLANGGQRVATFLIYLNDVEEGGETGFPEVGFKIVPKKGNAILWYNIYRNGLPDYNTMHEACPVRKGEKWIVTKWVHENPYDQNFRTDGTVKKD